MPNPFDTPHKSFALLLNLVNAGNTDDASTLWGFIQKYAPDAPPPESAPLLDKLVHYAIRYYQDFVLPKKSYRAPDARELTALEALITKLEGLSDNEDAESFMTEVFSAGKENGYAKEELCDWFKAIYEIALGQSEGPRFGAFVKLYGRGATVALIRTALERG